MSGFRGERHADVKIAQHVDSFCRLSRRCIGASQRQFQIGARRLPVFFQYGHRFLRPVFHQKRVGIKHMRVSNQQRLGVGGIEIRQCGDGLRRPARLQVRSTQIEADVVAEVAGLRLGPVQRIDGFRVIVIQGMGIAENQPRQRARIFRSMMLGIGLHAGIGRGSSILKQLASHGS